MRYHPDDCPRRYLRDEDVLALDAELRCEYSDAEDRAVLAFIREHERLHRARCLDVLAESRYKEEVEAIAQRFLREHGNWAHRISPVYWKFYEMASERTYAQMA